MKFHYQHAESEGVCKPDFGLRSFRFLIADVTFLRTVNSGCFCACELSAISARRYRYDCRHPHSAWVVSLVILLTTPRSSPFLTTRLVSRWSQTSDHLLFSLSLLLSSLLPTDSTRLAITKAQTQMGHSRSESTCLTYCHNVCVCVCKRANMLPGVSLFTTLLSSIPASSPFFILVFKLKFWWNLSYMKDYWATCCFNKKHPSMLSSWILKDCFLNQRCMFT